MLVGLSVAEELFDTPDTPSAVYAQVPPELGVAVGVGIVVGSAQFKDFDAIIPWYWLSVGVGAAFVLGVLAGLYPAWRASRLDPAEAVRPAA